MRLKRDPKVQLIDSLIHNKITEIDSNYFFLLFFSSNLIFGELIMEWEKELELGLIADESKCIEEIVMFSQIFVFENRVAIRG